MIRLPMLNVDLRFAAFVMAMNGRHLGAAPNALYLASSAEGVFGAVIARCDNRRDRINLLNQEGCRNEALERRSEALHIGRCGGRAVRHEPDVSNIRFVASAVNGDQISTIALPTEGWDRCERLLKEHAAR